MTINSMTINAASHRPLNRSFPLGRLQATPGVARVVSGSDLLRILQRHASCDWGDVHPEDWEANDRALEQGGRLFSAYSFEPGLRLWVITEAGRHATTVLLPSEY